MGEHLINRPEVLDDMARLHRDIERAAAALGAGYCAPLVCGAGCAACCRDELTVFAIEAELIRRGCPDLLQHAAPHPPGRCALLAENATCRAYAQRPYVCRTQGLPLRWRAPAPGESSGDLVEYRDICPLNEHCVELTALPAEQCWTIGPWEERLRVLARRWDGSGRRRIALRDLFTRGQ